MLKKLVYSLITKTGIAAINFVILLLSSRYLGVSSRGEISIFVLNITIIQMVNEVYTGYSIIHFIPKFNFKKIVVVGLIYSLIFCSLSNTMLVWFHKQLVNLEWTAYAISLLVIFNTFNCVLILGKQNLRYFNRLSFLQPLLLLIGILVYVFILKIYTVHAFIFPLFFSFLIAFITSSIRVSRYFNSDTSNINFELKPILMSGLLYQSGSIMYIFCNRYSYYLLPDSISVGLYSSASSLMEAVLIIVNGISPVLISRIANRSKESDNWVISLTLAKTSFLFSVLVVSCLVLVPSSFFTFLLGSGFIGIKTIMLWYAPTVLMASFFLVISNYFVALGKQNIPAFAYGLGCISSILAAPFLIETYEIKGAAINAFLSFFIICLTMTLLFLQQNKGKTKRIFSLSSDIQNLSNWFSPMS